MKKLFRKHRMLLKKISMVSILVLALFEAEGQFAPGTSTTSNVQLIINGVSVGKGFYQAGTNSTTNVAVGIGALGNNTLNAYNNTAVGLNALGNSLDARACVAVGTGALGNANGSDNTAVGSLSLGAVNNTGTGNAALGAGSLANNTSGSYNVAMGLGSLANNTQGITNTGLGYQSLGSISTTDRNTSVGFQSLRWLAGTSSYSNTAVGSHSFWFYTSGNNNTAVGCSTLVYKTAGDNNSVFGAAAYGTAGSGSNNCAFGFGALGGVAAGDYNVAIGSGATVTSGANYQLSIQNVIYGTTMSSMANSRLGIGVVPVATAASGTYPNSIAKLHVGGTLRIGTVSTGTPTGEYLFIDGQGMVSKAVLPAGIGGISNACTTVGNIPRITNIAGSGNLGCSQINDNGTTSVGIGIVPGGTAKLEVGGTLKINTVNVVDNTDLVDNSYLWVDVNGIVNQSNSTFWNLNGNANTIPGTGAGQNFLGTRDAQRLAIATNATERITVLATGNVGIRNTAPVAPLEVSNTVADNYLRISGPTPSEHFLPNNGNGNIGRIGSASGLNDFIQGANAGDFVIQNVGGAGALILGAGNVIPPGQNGLEIMRMYQVAGQNTGRVGIRTGSNANTTATLHVNGTVRFQALPLAPANPQLNYVLIDANGNLFRSNALTPAGTGNRPSAGSATVSSEIETKITTLESEIKSLRSLVELMMSVKPNTSSSQQFNIYPNPATSNIRIEPNSNTKLNTSLFAEVRDISNRLIITQALANKSANISLNQNLAAGTYLVAIYEDGKIIQTEKIQVVK